MGYWHGRGLLCGGCVMVMVMTCLKQESWYSGRENSKATINTSSIDTTTQLPITKKNYINRSTEDLTTIHRTENIKIEREIPQEHPLDKEETYRTLAYEFEVLLEDHRRSWRHLTNSSEVVDVGGVFVSRQWLRTNQGRSIKHIPNEPNRSRLTNHNTPTNEALTSMNHLFANHVNSTYQASTNHDNNSNHIKSTNRALTNNPGTPSIHQLVTKLVKTNEESKTNNVQANSRRRTKRDSGLPVFFMPGKKKTRECVSTGGLLSGYNAFSYLSFVTGVLSLVLNINNNINNNNNNNNLNDNSAISNSNVDANVNGNTANQIVVFPPGRKRRSLLDVARYWLSQSTSTTHTQHITNTTPTHHTTNTTTLTHHTTLTPKQHTTNNTHTNHTTNTTTPTHHNTPTNHTTSTTPSHQNTNTTTPIHNTTNNNNNTPTHHATTPTHQAQESCSEGRKELTETITIALSFLVDAALTGMEGSMEGLQGSSTTNPLPCDPLPSTHPTSYLAPALRAASRIWGGGKGVSRRTKCNNMAWMGSGVKTH
ncbi:hypothetical protein Pcinc_022525 [Petrolisthes cinctipes]|uniref:Uncharacterized protein n=1 Tax=Petrolisthes cinctipes TaxID=88211 RepID=A0AAE1FEG6_PETCI|nr:hypothetical protein Pcinc_022525 [Petrolisthes cinctipes]